MSLWQRRRYETCAPCGTTPNIFIFFRYVITYKCSCSLQLVVVRKENFSCVFVVVFVIFATALTPLICMWCAFMHITKFFSFHVAYTSQFFKGSYFKLIRWLFLKLKNSSCFPKITKVSNVKTFRKNSFCSINGLAIMGFRWIFDNLNVWQDYLNAGNTLLICIKSKPLPSCLIEQLKWLNYRPRHHQITSNSMRFLNKFLMSLLVFFVNPISSLKNSFSFLFDLPNFASWKNKINMTPE